MVWGGWSSTPPLWDFVKELTKNSIFSPYCLPPMSLAPPLTTFSVCPWCLQVLFIQCDSLFILSKVITEHLEWHFKINFQIKNMFSDDVLLCEAYTYLYIYENFKSLNAIQVYSHSNWLAIFCATNCSPVLARERWQNTRNSSKSTIFPEYHPVGHGSAIL